MRGHARSGRLWLQWSNEGHPERSFFRVYQKTIPTFAFVSRLTTNMTTQFDINTNRRTVITTTAAGLTGGLLATLLGSDPARAQTELSLAIDGDNADLDGGESISGVVLDCSIEWAYDLPSDASPELVVVELAAGVGEVSVVGSSETPQLFGKASGSESFETDLLAEGLVTTTEVRAGVEVTVEARLRVEDASGTALARESARDSAVVEATTPINATAYGDVGGSGDLRIETV